MDPPPPEKTEGKAKYTLSGRRWVVLIAFSTLRFLGENEWITFSPITNDLVDEFHVSSSSINLLSAVFMFTYLVFAFPSAWLLERFGLRVAFITASVLLLAGSVLRFIGALVGSFPVLLTGQAIASISQAFTLQSSSSVSGKWFGESERASATAVGFVMGIVGNMVAFILVPLLIATRLQLAWFLLAQLVVSAFSLLFSAVFVRSSPPSPPSAAAARLSQERPVSETLAVALLKVWKALKAMSTSIGFVLNLVAASLVSATFWDFQTTAEQALSPHDISSFEAGIICAVMLAAAVIGALIIGPMVDSTHRYKEFMVGLALLSTISLTAFSLLFRFSYYSIATLVSLGVFAATSGIGMNMIAPVAFELGIELVFPVLEGYTSTVFMVVANLLGFTLLFILDALKAPDGSMFWSYVFMVGCCLLGFACALFIPKQYKRLEFEQRELSELSTIESTEKKFKK